MHYGEDARIRARDALLCMFFAARRTAGIFLLTLFALVSTPSWAQVRYYYDELGRLIEAVAPDGNSVQYTYDPAGNIISVKKLTSATVSLAEFTPNAGPVGSTVTLYGSGFSATPSSNSVKFNGISATVSAATLTTLVVNVPPGATTGVITVANSMGSATSPTVFVVGATSPAAPTITGFTPNIGTAGTVVSVSGSNFQLEPEDNKAALGALFAAVIKDVGSPTATALKLTVPPVAASGKISIATPYGKATSAADFYALPSTVNLTDVEFKGRLTVDGPALNVTTTAIGKKAVLLFDATAGQRLHFVGTSSTFAGAVAAAVYAADGRLIENLYLTNNGVVDFANSLSGGAATGTYTVVLSPQANDKGSVSLSVVSDVMGVLVVDAGSPTNVSLNAGQNGRYTFAGTAGQLVSVVLSGNTLDDGNASTSNSTRIEVLSPSDPITPFAGSNISGGVATGNFGITLPETGNYTLILNPAGLDKGALGIQLKSYATGALTVNGSTPINLSAGRSGRYSFTAEQGKGYVLAITGLTVSSGSGPLTMVLRRNDGTVVRSCNSESVCDLAPTDTTSAGTYFVDLVPTGASAATFNLVLAKEVDVGVLTVDAAAATTVNTTFPGQDARLTFNGTAGQVVTVVMSGNTMDDGNSVTIQSTSVIVFQSGNFVTPIGYGFISTGQASGTFDLTLPVAGAYTLFVRPSGFDKGSIAIHLKSYASGTLTVGNSTPVNLSAGRNARYTFTAEAGKGYGLALTNLVFNPAGATVQARLKKADGSVLANCTFSGEDNCAFDAANFSLAGLYTIEFDPTGVNAASFNAVLSKEVVAGPLVVDAAAPTVVTTVLPGQNARVTFNGTAGQTVSIVVSGNTMDDGNPGTNNYTAVNLLRPSNGGLAGNTFLYNGAAGITLDLTLPETGTYTVYLDPRGLDKGSLSLQIKSLVLGALVVDGSTAVSLSAGRNGRYSFTAEAGKGYGLALTGLGFTPAGGTATATLRRADGTYLTQCTFTASGSCDLGTRFFAAAGTYLIDFDPSGVYATAFNAVLSKDLASALTVDAASVTTVTTVREGQNARITFNGTAGQLVSVLLSGNTIDDGNAATGNYTYAYLFKPSDANTQVPGGSQIGSTYLYTGTVSGAFDATLPESGTYTLYLTPASLDKGSVGVRVIKK